MPDQKPSRRTPRDRVTLPINIPTEQYDVMRIAAEMDHRSISGFIRLAALEKATRAIAEANSIAA